MRGLWRGLLWGLFVAFLTWWAQRRGKAVGTLLGIPYDLRWPTLMRVRERYWNPRGPRLFTPHVWGWGWSLNLYRLARWLGLAR